MPFSSLTDPIDLARAQAALETAWAEIRPALSQDTYERERTRLAYAVAALASLAKDEDDLARRAVERYRSQS
jgi:hypothetical protein